MLYLYMVGGNIRAFARVHCIPVEVVVGDGIEAKRKKSATRRDTVVVAVVKCLRTITVIKGSFLPGEKSKNTRNKNNKKARKIKESREAKVKVSVAKPVHEWPCWHRASRYTAMLYSTRQRDTGLLYNASNR